MQKHGALVIPSLSSILQKLPLEGIEGEESRGVASEKPERFVLARIEVVDRDRVARAMIRRGKRGAAFPLRGRAPDEGSIVLVARDRPASSGRERDWWLAARPGTARAGVFEQLARYRLDPDFPTAVWREVDAFLRAPGVDDPSLADRTELPFVTIDNADSRDLDQAIHIARDGAGYLVRYALADAAYYVRPGSALFAEALRRGATYYAPRFAVPMLPPALSEGLVSLNADATRRALVFEMPLDERGRTRSEPHGTRLVRARVRSRAKLSYDGVQAFYDEPATSPIAGQPYAESLGLLREVGRLRIAEARERDVVPYDRHELLIDLSADGGAFVLRRDLRNDASLYNEQLSLLCNTLGADFLARDAHRTPHVQPVFRVHEPPPPEAIARLAGVIDAIAGVHGLDPSVWRWRRRGRKGEPRESLADYLARLPCDGRSVRVREAIERQVLLTNHRSVYGGEPARHYALGVARYARFSSPMREIVGVFTHKEALEKTAAVAATDSAETDEELRALVIEAGNRSKETQRTLTKAVTKLAVDELLRRDLELSEEARPRRRATLLGLSPTRMYVRLDDPPLELKVYLDGLASARGDRFELDGSEVELRVTREGGRQGEEEGEEQGGGDGGRRFRVGDAVELRTAGYDERRGRWLLLPR